MTAEVVVMNRAGVALAADSAVTYGDSKIFNTGNKLFMLAPGIPVGVLIYNISTYMNLPWEIVIAAFRDHIIERELVLETLDEYGDLFIQFLKDRAQEFATDEQQKIEVGSTVSQVFDRITRAIWEHLENQVYETATKVSEEEIEAATTIVLKRVHSVYSEYPDICEGDELTEFRQCFQDRFLDLLNQLREQYFDRLPLSDENQERLLEICFLLFAKRDNSPSYSGVVFAGYGSSDLLPQCKSFIIHSHICDRLRYRPDQSMGISFPDASGIIVPFAQTEIVENFMMGRHPTYYEAIRAELEKVVSSEDSDRILQTAQNATGQSYTNQILEVVSALPKEELASMAETIVSLTSFMRKVSMTPETVGGPVDVAVISKKDGFVWIQRKHYFDRSDNAHFDSNSPRR